MRTLAIILLLNLFCFAGAAWAQEFSAEMVTVTTEAKGTPIDAKIYVGKDKIRIEPREGGMGRQKGVVIVNPATQTSDVLMPERRMYMEMANDRNPQAFSFFRPADLENACSDWLKLARKPGGTCHKVGHEEVNGRDAVKYEGTSADGQTGDVWIDVKLRFLVKWDEKNGRSGEMRNIQEGAQPSRLFEIPPDYQKFDMGAMMKHPTPQP
jgi:hypothetical protein